MMQIILQAQAFFSKRDIIYDVYESERRQEKHTTGFLPYTSVRLCALRLPSGDCVQVYYPAMCSGLFPALSQIPLIIWNRPVQHRLVAFLVQGPLMSVGACKRLPGFNLSLTTQLSEPPAPFFPPFLSYCSSLSSIAGSTHWTATGWSRPCSAFCVTSKSDRVSCLSAALFFSKMLQAGAATVWCLGRQRT